MTRPNKRICQLRRIVSAKNVASVLEQESDDEDQRSHSKRDPSALEDFELSDYNDLDDKNCEESMRKLTQGLDITELLKWEEGTEASLRAPHRGNSRATKYRRHKEEQAAWMSLFKAAQQAVRNFLAHKSEAEVPEQDALDSLSLVNLLYNKLEAMQAVLGPNATQQPPVE